MDPVPILQGCGLVAIAIVAVAAGMLLARKDGSLKLGARMGSPTWDFSRSWASNITVGGALIGAVLAVITAQGTQHPAQFKTQYLTLNLFFLALAVAAPCIYNACRSGALLPAPVGDIRVVYYGHVEMFLLSSVATVCAVYGQLAVFWFAVSDFAGHGLIDGSASHALLAVDLVIGVTLVPYLVQTIYWSVRSQRVPPDGATALDATATESPAPWPLP